MGYSTLQLANGSFQLYHPDDDESTFYISREATCGEIIDAAIEKWPHIEGFDNIKISAEFIRTSWVGIKNLALLDPIDYTKFLKVTRI